VTAEAELQALAVVGALERQSCRLDLEDVGITASPADIEAWLSMPPKSRRHAAEAFAIWQATPEPAWKKQHERRSSSI
jgi:hypothetical protein